MASIRDLKKDTDFLTSEVFTECYVKQFAKADIDKKRLAEIMVEAVKFRSEFIARTNHSNGKENPKIVKEYFKKLRHDLLAGYINMSKDIEGL